MIRVAAVGDVHLGEDSAGLLAPELAHVARARRPPAARGRPHPARRPVEAAVLAEELAGVPIPMVARARQPRPPQRPGREVRAAMEARRASACSRGSAASSTLDGVSVGVAGVKGFGGGFAGASGSEFGEPEMKAFIRHTARHGRAPARRAGRARDRRADRAAPLRAGRRHPAGRAARDLPVPRQLPARPRRSTPPAPTSPSTATRTTGRRRASPPAASTCATSPSR